MALFLSHAHKSHGHAHGPWPPCVCYMNKLYNRMLFTPQRNTGVRCVAEREEEAARLTATRNGVSLHRQRCFSLRRAKQRCCSIPCEKQRCFSLRRVQTVLFRYIVNKKHCCSVTTVLRDSPNTIVSIPAYKTTMFGNGLSSMSCLVLAKQHCFDPSISNNNVL